MGRDVAALHVLDTRSYGRPATVRRGYRQLLAVRAAGPSRTHASAHDQERVLTTARQAAPANAAGSAIPLPARYASQHCATVTLSIFDCQRSLPRSQGQSGLDRCVRQDAWVRRYYTAAAARHTAGAGSPQAKARNSPHAVRYTPATLHAPLLAPAA
ncbi:hypothetical protein GCM10020220_102490 [Nonomuraea rubra]